MGRMQGDIITNLLLCLKMLMALIDQKFKVDQIPTRSHAASMYMHTTLGEHRDVLHSSLLTLVVVICSFCIVVRFIPQCWLFAFACPVFSVFDVLFNSLTEIRQLVLPSPALCSALGPLMCSFVFA